MIQRTSNSQVVFSLSGKMEDEHMTQLKALIGSEANERNVVLDLKNLILAGQKDITFLESCETDGVTLRHCAPYVREWISRQRG
jgi:hypothetical protein